jgi:hypothetical protein
MSRSLRHLYFIVTEAEGFQTYLRNTIEQSDQHINDIVFNYQW